MATEKLQEAIKKNRMKLKELEQQNLSDLDKKVSLPLLDLTIKELERVVMAVEEGEPFVCSAISNIPEIYNAMDLPHYPLFRTSYLLSGKPEDIDECEAMGMPPDLCTVLRTSIHSVLTDRCPKPTVFVGVLIPCDGVTIIQEVIMEYEKWRDVPIFIADPPYIEDDRGIDYYAEEIKRLVSFLEDHTGKKLDMDRFRMMLEETNRQIELWGEYYELRRAVPCPHGHFTTNSSVDTFTHQIVNHHLAGNPIGTALIREMVDDAEERVRAKRGWLENERIRVLWCDNHPYSKPLLDLFTWLEQEWGAVVVMEVPNCFPYTPVDTSSADSIFKGIAKKTLCDLPMLRQVWSVSDIFVNDIRRIVKDFKIDCIIFPDHMGHKDVTASRGIFRELAREIGIPYLHIGLDLFDYRYTPVETIKDKISQFFTTMGLA